MEIKPAGMHSTDSFTWDYSKTGHYTVKSGYWVITNVLKKEKVPVEYTQPSLETLYELAWNADACPKIKQFLWKCLRNSLPIAGIRKYRHMAKEGTCLRCDGNEETMNHFLFTCPFARLVWATSTIPAPPGLLSGSFYSNFFYLMTSKGNGATNLAPWIMWRLWKNRNDLCFNGVEYNAQEVINKAKEDAEEWVETRGKELEEHQREGIRQTPMDRRDSKWIPPPSQWYKCNLDGACSKEGNNCGMGWIIRDSTGNASWLGAKSNTRYKSSIEIEAEALKWAIQSVYSLGFRYVIFESDSRELVRMINDNEWWPKIKPCCEEIVFGLSKFAGTKLMFRIREANMVADRVSKEALSFQNYAPRLYTVMPNWVENLIEVDKPLYNVLG